MKQKKTQKNNRKIRKTQRKNKKAQRKNRKSQKRIRKGGSMFNKLFKKKGDSIKPSIKENKGTNQSGLTVPSIKKNHYNIIHQPLPPLHNPAHLWDWRMARHRQPVLPKKKKIVTSTKSASMNN